MSVQMYADLIVSELTAAGSTENGFKYALVGTLNGSNVQIDALSTPIPLNEFDFLVSASQNTRPIYKNGDRLFIVPANDGQKLVVVGRLI